MPQSLYNKARASRSNQFGFGPDNPPGMLPVPLEEAELGTGGTAAPVGPAWTTDSVGWQHPRSLAAHLKVVPEQFPQLEPFQRLFALSGLQAV